MPRSSCSGAALELPAGSSCHAEHVLMTMAVIVICRQDASILGLGQITFLQVSRHQGDAKEEPVLDTPSELRVAVEELHVHQGEVLSALFPPVLRIAMVCELIRVSRCRFMGLTRTSPMDDVSICSIAFGRCGHARGMISYFRASMDWHCRQQI